MCKHVPPVREVSLRSGWFGKPKYSAGEGQCVTHAGILVVPLELKYLEAYSDGNRLCTSGNTKDRPFLQELEMKAIFLPKECSYSGPQQCFSPGWCAPCFFANGDLCKCKFSYQIPPEFSKKKGELHLVLCHFHIISKRGNYCFRL